MDDDSGSSELLDYEEVEVMEMVVFLQVSRFSISLGLEYFFFFFYRGDFEIFR